MYVAYNQMYYKGKKVGTPYKMTGKYSSPSTAKAVATRQNNMWNQKNKMGYSVKVIQVKKIEPRKKRRANQNNSFLGFRF